MKKKYSGGGFVKGMNKTIFETEGCVFYPNIDDITDFNTVSKVYTYDHVFQKEMENYDAFDKADPTFQYHCKRINNGIIQSTDPRLTNYKKIFRNNNGEYHYINIQYAGVPMADYLFDNEFKNKYRNNVCVFFANVLPLTSTNGKYIVHADPHVGNVCADENGNIRYIDLTNVVMVDRNTIITTNDDIGREISSMCGILLHMFGYDDNYYVDNLRSLSEQDISYYSFVEHAIRILMTNTLINLKKTKTPPPPPLRKSRKKHRSYSDSDDENFSILPALSFANDINDTI
jgi:hypothetical protein